MKRLIVLAVCAALFIGCGAYRVTYQVPSKAQENASPLTKRHAHGIGPLIVGGGLFFFILNPMSPALIDYTGSVDARTICPDGFSEVSHYHTPVQQARAALVSWLLIVNWFHRSNVDWTCIR